MVNLNHPDELAISPELVKQLANETTSQEVARLAAKGLRDPGSLTNEEARRVFASALTQVAKEKIRAKGRGKRG